MLATFSLMNTLRVSKILLFVNILDGTCVINVPSVVVWWLESRSLNHKDASSNPPTDGDSEFLAKTLKAQATVKGARRLHVQAMCTLYHL